MKYPAQIPMRKTKDGRVYISHNGGRPPLPPGKKKVAHKTSYDPDLFARVQRIAAENRTSIGIVVNALLRQALGESHG